MREKDISVAVMYPGGRIDRIMEPLLTTDMKVHLNPSDAYDRDIVMLDNADKKIWIPILKKQNKECKVLYRIRGDMLRAYIEMNRTKLKYHIVKQMIKRVDGAVSIEPVLARQFNRVTGVSPIGFASLAKDINNWPKVNHTSEGLRAITLTNLNYFGKVQPLIDYAPIIEEYYKENPGYWYIYGRGKYSGYLADNLATYDHIKYMGYTENPKEKLNASNIMFHLSRFDSVPNAMLEGMACNLPVICNPYPVFAEYGFPLIIRNRNNITQMLEKLKNPDVREKYGFESIRNIQMNHSKEVIGQQYTDFFKEIVE